MERLPELATAAGPLALPLCGETARRVAAALVQGRDFRGDGALLSEALARDPALTLWAVMRAHQLGCRELSTVDALAGWLSVSALDAFHPIQADPSPNGPQRGDRQEARGNACETWATLAASSILAAALAAQIARQVRLDDKAAYLLGLLHNAHEWFAAADGGLETPSREMLPPWMRDPLDRIDGNLPGEIASVVDCVGAAVQLAKSDDPAGKLPQGLTTDRQALAAPLAAARDDWHREAGGNLLGNLVEKLRRLRDLETSYAQTLEAEKIESLKELAYGAGHEINNPLANISARAQTLLHSERDPERRRMLASINAQAFRAHEMIADMMLFARPPAVKAEPFDVGELLARLHAELVEQAARQQTQFVLHAPPAAICAVADKTQIAVALRSLLVNALEALVTGGRVELALADGANDRQNVRITVSDNGPGVPAEVRPHIFDPFYSGREAGRGLGLGLSKCWRVVTMHRGHIQLDSPGGRGAVFTVTLPRDNTR
jgi:signal transduction histidine kinase